MPKCFDVHLALEMFREIDTDKDAKITYKEFSDCMRF
jgi:Ca2+-binding EF-hand superfamily protein